MSYSFIRIDPVLTVPALSTFCEVDNEILIYTPSRTEPFQVGGEMAQAVRAFLSGQIKFPVTVNGVLDIHAEWTQTAKETKDWVAHDEKPKTVFIPEWEQEPERKIERMPKLVQDLESVPGEPKINWNKVHKKLKGESL